MPSAGNGQIALGHDNGTITILYNMWNKIIDACEESQKDVTHLNPTNMVTKSMYWHVHEVKTLAFGGLNGTTLLSGGEEAVLVSWQLNSSGSNANSIKPTHTLPRLCKGQILSIATNCDHGEDALGGREMVFMARDQSITCVRIPDYNTLWSMQGLAAMNCEDVGLEVHPIDYVRGEEMKTAAANDNDDKIGNDNKTLFQNGGSGGMSIQLDPRTHLPILGGLKGAPGCLHWYDYSAVVNGGGGMGRVRGVLECVKYNRTSRQLSNGKASLVPRVGLFGTSADGNVMVTVDYTLSIVEGMGRKIMLDGDLLSEASSVKFWSLSKRNKNDKGDISMPYHLDAFMPNPHGRTAGVAGLILSKSGSMAITISAQEDAFRIWTREIGNKRNTQAQEETMQLYKQSPWKCKCSIPTPSSNSGPPTGAMALSADESLLAVAYGCNVSLWDHEECVLLRTVLIGVDNFPVHTVKFTGEQEILCATAKSVHVKSVFGNDLTGCGEGGWGYTNFDLHKKNEGGSATYDVVAITSTKKNHGGDDFKMVNDNEVAIAVVRTNSKNEQFSKILIVNESTGEQVRETNKRLSWTLPGEVKTMCSDNKGRRLFVLMSNHELLLLSRDENTQHSKRVPSKQQKQRPVGSTTMRRGPKLDIVLAKEEHNDDDDDDDNEHDSNKRGKITMESSMETESAKQATGFRMGGLASADLPIMGGSFFRAYAGERLKAAADGEKE